MKQTDLEVADPIMESTAVTGYRTLAPVGSVLGCCLLVSLAAQVRVPVPGTDVFMTLQPLAVLLTGFALSPRRAVAAMLLYLACGAAGLPVFAGSAGLVGPTGGYLVGFVVAVWLISTLKGGHGAGFGRLLPVGAAGLLVIFALGIAWRAGLAFFLGLFGGEVWLAISTGLIPFWAKSVVELLVAVTLVVSVRRTRSRHRLRGL